MWIGLLACYGVAALVALGLVPRFFLPAEDAVILFQYSRNLAVHGAITYLPHGPHVEGATDFAWMLLVAAGIRVGMSPLWVSALANVVSASVLALLLLRLAGKRFSFGRWLCTVGAMACMPQILAAAAGFAVLPDAALLTALVAAVLEHRVRMAAALALLFCLFRPDAVVFALPLLLGLLWRAGWRPGDVGAMVGWFVAPGIAYFFWRWHYFGALLPLPFYVKADAHRVAGLFVAQTVHQSLLYLLFAAVLLFLLRFARVAEHLWLLLPLLALPTLFFWSMRLDQNVAGRFFYYIPLAAAILLAVNWRELRGRHDLLVLSVAGAWLVLLAMPFLREIRTFRDEQFADVKSIAEALHGLPQQGTILTSEAGFLAYFSGWTTIDAWGLNTPEFAHRFLQAGDVARLRPDLVVFHPDRTEGCVADASWPATYADRTWPHLTRNLALGADRQHYAPWVISYGSEFYRNRKHWKYGEGDRECWLVRRDAPVYSGVTGILAAHHAVPAALLRTSSQPAGE